MKIITSTLSDSLAEVYPEFEDAFGFGPCGAYAALKRAEGWGEIAVCLAHTANGLEFPHYVIWDDGIIDLCNPMDEELTYSDLEILDADEMPELVDEAEINWLWERGI